MPNVFDYLSWRGDLSFRQSAFNEVDAMILSRLSYAPLELVKDPLAAGPFSVERACRVLLATSPEKQEETRGMLPLYRALLRSPRFSRLLLLRYSCCLDEETQTQFAAVTVMLDEDTCFVAFRGTDGSLVGWKEDLNMAFVSPVPSQTMAVEYVNALAEEFSGRIYLGGHSKGGNLAMYALGFCRPEVAERVQGVYNLDGPGFVEGVWGEAQEARLAGKLNTLVPQSSLVGMLLEHSDDYSIVHSTQKTGFFQHDTFSWEILRDRFVRLRNVTRSGRVISSAVGDWIAGMSAEQRERFADTVYSILTVTNARSVHELSANWLTSAGRILRGYRDLDEVTRQAVSETLAALCRSAEKEVTHELRGREEAPALK